MPKLNNLVVKWIFHCGCGMWDVKTNRASGKSAEAQKINFTIDRIRGEVNRIRDLYDCKDEVREKFLNMHEYAKQKKVEISNLENRIDQLKQEH